MAGRHCGTNRCSAGRTVVVRYPVHGGSNKNRGQGCCRWQERGNAHVVNSEPKELNRQQAGRCQTVRQERKINCRHVIMVLLAQAGKRWWQELSVCKSQCQTTQRNERGGGTQSIPVGKNATRWQARSCCNGMRETSEKETCSGNTLVTVAQWCRNVHPQQSWQWW